MNDNKSELIEKYAQQKLEGKSFSEIRNELKSINLTQDEINALIKEIDSEVLKREVENVNNEDGKEKLIIGYVLLIIGLIITTLMYLGIINAKFIYILGFGPILVGFYMVYKAKYKKKEEPKKEERKFFKDK